MLQAVPNFDTKGKFALMIDGVGEIVSSRGKARGEVAKDLELIVDIHGLENVQKIAQELKADIQLREHFGHQRLVSLVNTKKEYRIAAPVELEMRIKNFGKKTVRFMDGGQQRGPCNHQFAFVSKPAVPDICDAFNFGGIAVFRNLEPGATFIKKVDITQWFKLYKAQSYEITALFEMELHKESFGVDYLRNKSAVGRCRVFPASSRSKSRYLADRPTVLVASCTSVFFLGTWNGWSPSESSPSRGCKPPVLIGALTSSLRCGMLFHAKCYLMFSSCKSQSKL
ncbi:MAG: hypothetical protein VXZ82_02655 [Planctomycetota bacterium]|nr:hypothetical protein [Planctomycetota bacterium]